MNAQSFPIMTDDEFVTVAVDALNKVVAQGKQSSSWGSCLYRSDEVGVCCAVGHIIKDEFYTTSLESKVVGTSVVQTAVSNSLQKELTPDQSYTLSLVQRTHDNLNRFTAPETFKDRLVASAKDLCPDSRTTFRDRIPDHMKLFIKTINVFENQENLS